MATTPNGLRKQRLRLDGDEIISPALYTGENGKATITGVNAAIPNDDKNGPAWKLEVGGTGNTSYDDQYLIYYDAASRQLKSSTIKITDLAGVAGDVAKLGPFMDQVKGKQSEIYNKFLNGPQRIFNATIELEPNAQWVWLRVTATTYMVWHNSSNAYYPKFDFYLSPEPTVDDNDGVLQSPSNWFHADTKTPPLDHIIQTDGVPNNITWSWEGKVPDTFKLTNKLRVIMTFKLQDNVQHFLTVGYVLGWYKPAIVAPPLNEDPNIVVLPPNFTATNFRLLFPGPTFGVYNSNKEYSYWEEVYEVNGVKHLNWAASRPYDWGLKVLYTLEQRFNGGHPTPQTTAARQWLNNMYLPSTALASQANVGPLPDSIYQTVILTNMELLWHAGQANTPGTDPDEPREGYYTRDFKAETIPYIP